MIYPLVIEQLVNIWINMAHLVRWFTYSKDGDFFCSFLDVYQKTEKQKHDSALASAGLAPLLGQAVGMTMHK